MSSPAVPDRRLTLLGVPHLLRADGSAHPVQRLRMALLAVIAVSGRQGIPRETLLGLLWPERDPESARHALEQALYALRRDHGGEFVIGTDPVRLGTAVACDVPEFEAALRDEAWADAIVRYGGPLLEGLHVKDSPAFDHWLDWERERLAAGYRRALAAHALAREAAGDHPAAVESWQRYTREDPLSPLAAAGLVRSLVHAGQPATARAALDGWERLVRSELGRDPDPQVRAAFDAAHAPVVKAPPPPVTSPAANDSHTVPGVRGATPATEPGHADHGSEPRRVWAIAAVVAILAMVGWGVTVLRGPGDASVRVSDRLRVAPIAIATADSAVGSVGRSLPAMIAARLAGEEGGTLPPTGDDGGAWVLDGSISGDRTALILELVARREADGAIAGSAQVTGSLAEFGRVVDEGLSRLLVASVTARLGDPGSLPLAAVREYMAGLHHYAADDLHAAIAALRTALSHDSTFAAAALLLRQASRETDGADLDRATRLAWSARDRLPRADRDLIVAIAGPDFPSQGSPLALLERLRQHCAGHLQHGGGWYELGSLLYAAGHALGQPNPWAEARAALERAIALDSLLAAPARRALVEMAALQGDTALLTRVAGAVPDAADATPWDAWLRAFTARDSTSLARLRPGLAALDTTRLLMVRAIAIRTGYDLADAIEATRIWGERARTGPELSDAAGYRYRLALNLGRPGDARRHATGMLREWSEPDRQAYIAATATWWDGDRDDGARAAAAAVAVGGDGTDDPGARGGQLIRRCVAEQFKVVRLGDLGTAAGMAARLRRGAPGTPAWVEATLEGCAAFLEGMVVARTAPARATAIAESLEHWQREASVGSWAFPEILATATLWAALGEWARASAVLERRSPRQVRFLNSTLRLAAEAAWRSGNLPAARRAASHYLALMAEADPSFAGDVARVRSILAQVPAR